MFKSKKLWGFLAAALVVLVILISLPYVYLSGSREYQQVSVPANGYQLTGYLSTASEPGEEWVIFLHGNRKEGQDKYLYRMIRQEIPEEYSVLAIDMRGFGDSPNAGMEGAEHIITRLEDIDAAAEYLQSEYGVTEDQIILLGHSLGAAQVMRAALDHSFSQAVAIGLGDWDGLLGDDRQVKTYSEKFLLNTGVSVAPTQVKQEGGEFSTDVLFSSCPRTPAWLIFASGDDGLTPLAPSYKAASQRCPGDLGWSVVPLSDHMYGTENQSLPGVLKDFRSRIMISLLMWRLDQVLGA